MALWSINSKFSERGTLLVNLMLFLFLPLHQNPFLVLVVLLIAGGLFMFTFESTQFNLEGFIMVLLASFIGGIRWTLTQVLMQKAELGECWSPWDGWMTAARYHGTQVLTTDYHQQGTIGCKRSVPRSLFWLEHFEELSS